ncbi:MAG: substrate-binding domain-containing protein [Spirochaetales bacterium]|jgi:tungstate transport system substrate-binding protein|nr:substrate-binding domain-containing protein [Spirochaetales bacterium]
MNKLKKISLAAGILLLAGTAFLTAEGNAEQPAPFAQQNSYQVRIKLASTTSTDNSGLFGAVLPIFEKETGIGVDVIAVGTGAAVALGKNGDVDIILVHARSLEDQFVAEGYGVNRRDLMHNDFVILGPPDDPAGIRGMQKASRALAAIAGTESVFISRGDESGTHVRERLLWEEASIAPDGVWYREAGQGMGAVLTMTNDMGGYTLADRGTYIAMQDKLNLEVLVEGEEQLFNPYGIIAVNPSVYPQVKYRAAMRLIAFLTSIEGQKAIGDFTVSGKQLFYPDAVDSSLLK